MASEGSELQGWFGFPRNSRFRANFGVLRGAPNTSIHLVSIYIYSFMLKDFVHCPAIRNGEPCTLNYFKASVSVHEAQYSAPTLVAFSATFQVCGLKEAINSQVIHHLLVYGPKTPL